MSIIEKIMSDDLNLIVVPVDEETFLKVIKNEHRIGNFRGDDHKMEINYKRRADSEFVGIVGFSRQVITEHPELFDISVIDDITNLGDCDFDVTAALKENYFELGRKDGSISPIVCFCGIEIYKDKDGKDTGYIHCLGVTKPYRRRNLSNFILEDIERECIESGFDLNAIHSTCNPISAKTHERVGYVVVHPGRLSSKGKRMQIRLTKYFKER